MAIGSAKILDSIIESENAYLEGIGVTFYDCVEQRVFPLYAPGGGLLASYLAILMVKSDGRSKRLDGGELPRRYQVFEDDDGWIFAAAEFSYEQLQNNRWWCACSLRTTGEYIAALKKMQQASTTIQRLRASVRVIGSRVRSKAHAFMAA